MRELSEGELEETENVGVELSKKDTEAIEKIAKSVDMTTDELMSLWIRTFYVECMAKTELQKKSPDVEGMIDKLFSEWDFTPSEIKRAVIRFLDHLEGQVRSISALETAVRMDGGRVGFRERNNAIV